MIYREDTPFWSETLDMQTFQSIFFFIAALLKGTIDSYHFLYHFSDLTLPGGHKVMQSKTSGLHFLILFI